LRCLAGHPCVCRSAALRPRPLRPQLKRDPLGGHSTILRGVRISRTRATGVSLTTTRSTSRASCFIGAPTANGAPRGITTIASSAGPTLRFQLSCLTLCTLATRPKMSIGGFASAASTTFATASRGTWPRLSPRDSVRPNKRLKLAGGDRSRGSGVLCPGGRRLSSVILAPARTSPAA